MGGEYLSKVRTVRHEVQVGLDGMKHGHEILRGKDTFERVTETIRAVRDAGPDLSQATMIHRGNLNEWNEMRDLAAEFEVREWSIDYPCVKGNWEHHAESPSHLTRRRNEWSAVSEDPNTGPHPDGPIDGIRPESYLRERCAVAGFTRIGVTDRSKADWKRLGST